MPGVASAFNGKISVAAWLVSLRSRLFQSRFTTASSDVANQPRTGVMTGACPSDEVAIASYHAGDGGYLELIDTRHVEDYELGLVTTEIRGAADGRRIHEEGVVHKSIAVHQSTRQVRPAT